MSLIELIRSAVNKGVISTPFTTDMIKQWCQDNSIVKSDGTEYAESSIESILSNSDISNAGSSNKNVKVLDSRTNNKGVKEYWFSDK